MLSTFRKHARSVGMTFILGVIVVVFVFWGIGSQGPGGASYVAKVDGQILTEVDYQKAYDNMLENYKRLFPAELSAEMIKQLDLKKRALEELINQRLLLAEANRLGLLITDDELAEEIPRILGGNFTKSRYLETLRLMRLSPEEFEGSQRNQLLIQRLLAAVTDSVSVTDQELKEQYLFDNQKVFLALVKVPLAEKALEIQPDLTAVREYYEKNKERYRKPERISLELLAYPQESFTSFVKPTEEEVKSYYYLYRNEKFTKPDQVRVRHILFQVPAGGDSKKRAEVRARAEQVLASIRGGRDFAEMAKSHSDDKNSARLGGDLGFVKKGQVLPQLETVAFGLKAGEVSDVIASPVGFHLIQVEQIKKGEELPLSEVRDEIIQEVKREKARDVMLERATADRERALKGSPLAELAEPLGLKARETALLSRTELLAQLSELKNVGASLFGLAQGQVGEIVETPEGVELFRVKEKREASYSAFDEVKDKVSNDFRHQLAQEKAKETGTEMLKMLEEGGTLREVAAKMGLKVEMLPPFGRNSGNPPEIPGLEADTVTMSPTQTYLNKLYTLKGDVYVAAIKERLQPDMGEFEKKKDALKNEWIARKRAEVASEYVKALKARAVEEGTLSVNSDFLSSL